MLVFGLTDEQRELKDLAHRFTERESFRARVVATKRKFFRSTCAEKAFAAGLMNFGVPKSTAPRVSACSTPA